MRFAPLLPICFALCAWPSKAAADDVIVYRNGLVWTGSGFTQRTLAVRDGRFVKVPRKSARSETVDLGGKFVVPAYANAHQHITNPDPAGSWTFIEEGVFYVWNPNSIVLGKATRDFFATSETVDVAFSQGGITEPKGHPEPLYVDILAKYVYKGMTLKDFLGNAFHYGRTPAEIDASLDLLKAQGADFVKAYLLFSEDYAKRRDDAAFAGEKGLNPANVGYLVGAARQRGLPAYFHVETRADALTASRSGAWALGHLPAYRQVSDPAELDLMRLSMSDAREIARRQTRVVPTYAVAKTSYDADAKKPGFDPVARDRVYAVQRNNLRHLDRAGASVLTGTDRGPAIFEEVEHWVAIGGMSAPAAVRAALATGRQLFPRRKIGCFEPGCEADFLVLAADPTKDIRALRRLTMIVKAGKTMIKPAGIDTGERQATDR